MATLTDERAGAPATVERDGESVEAVRKPPKKLRTMVLTLGVESRDWKVVYAAVSALASGLAAPHLIRDRCLAPDWMGPFEVDELDAQVIESIAVIAEGHDQGCSELDEPTYRKDRAIRDHAREAAARITAAWEMEKIGLSAVRKARDKARLDEMYAVLGRFRTSS
jgi:hypothetical protein